MSWSLKTSVKPLVVAMIHVGALPGTPRCTQTVQQLVQQAEADAQLYMQAGVDALLVENMNDVPYVRPADVGPEVVSVMTVVCAAVRRVVGRTVPLGCQVLAGCNREAVAVAQASDLNFIRAEGYVFGHVADEGYTDACAGPLLRYRRQIGADGVEIWADIKKKHSSHALTDDVSVTDTAKAAAFFGASAVVLTGSATGAETDAAQLTDVHEAVPQTPVVVGSGVTHDNVQRYMGAAGLIVGSHFKTNGRWEEEVCLKRVSAFMEKVKLLRSQSSLQQGL